MKTWQKRVLIVFLAALILFIGYTFIDMRKQNQKEQEALKRISEECADNIRSLEEERAQIEADIEATKTELENLTADMGSVLIVCTEPDSRIMTDIEPYLAGYDYTAVVALSNDYFPGNDGCLTGDDMAFLMNKGWDVAISVDRSTDIAGLYNRVVEAGYSAPVTVYFGSDFCSPEQEEIIKGLGIKTVIEYRSEEVTENAGDAENGSTGGLYHIAAYGNDANAARERFVKSIEASKSIAFTVGYRFDREKFRSENFANMLRNISGYVDDGNVEETNVQGAFERNELKQTLIRIASGKYEARLAELDEQLAAIEEEIRFAPEK